MGLIRSMKSFFTKATTTVAAGSNTARQEVFKEWNDQIAIKEGYLGSTYVYKAIDWQSKISTVRLDLFRYINQDEKEVIAEHPLKALIDRPNPVMSWSTFLTRLVQFRAVSGNALILKVRGSNKEVIELWPIPPAYITPIADDTLYMVKAYKYQNGSETYTIPKDDVIHWQAPNPAEPLWGVSPIQVASRIIDTDNQAVLWNKASMLNRAVPDGIMSTTETLTEEQYKDIMAKWTEQRQGARNAMKTLFLSGGFTYQRMAMTSQEMDFIQSRKFNREEITSAFGVPLLLLGVMEGSTYANYREARLSFWEDTATPLLNDFIDVLNHDLAYEFDGELWIEPNYMSVPALKERQLGYVETALKYQDYGYTMNHIDDVLGLGFGNVEHGDVAYVRSNLIPVHMMLPGEDEPEDSSLEDSINQLQESLKAKKSKSDDWSDERKELYWKAIEVKRAPFDSSFKADIAKQFTKEGKQVAKLLAEKGKGAAKSYIKSKVNRKEWEDLYHRNYRRIINQFGQEAESQLKGLAPTETKDEPFEFDPYDSLISKFIKESGAKKITSILDTSRADIAALIESGIADDLSTDEIVKDLKQKYTQFSTMRAFRIARTEVASASNFSLYAAGKQAPFKVRKSWINSKDDRVRDDHQFSETIDMDDKFKNGLEYPGDPSGSAKEVIQCRCTIAYRRVAER